MSDYPNPEQQLQSILSNVSVQGNLTTGDITQIFKIFVNLDQIPKPLGIPQNIISSSTDKFVGRERDLENLNQQLQRNNQVVIAAVEGMGGVGKTELAIQYSLLNLQLENYPGGICWLRAREQDIGLQIVNFARTDLDLNPPDDLELPDRVRWCWKRWREGNTLIVLDDVKDYSDIKPYLPPQGSQFQVLITTRLKLKLPSPLYLEVLPEQDALELLTQLVGSEKINNEPETAKTLCQRLGYLPLAIQLVGQYVEEYEISLTEEVKRLKDNGLDDYSISVQKNDKTWTSDIKGVKAAFELSWQELSKSAQKLGCLLSLFALAPIPWSLVESAAVGEDLEELKNARVELKRLNLLQVQDNYQLHQLIQEFFRDKQKNLANADKQKRNFCNAIVKIAKQVPIMTTISDVNKLNPLIPHFKETATFYQNWLSDEDLKMPFIGLSRFYHGQDAYTQALPWDEQCLLVLKERLGEEHIDITISLNNLAELYRRQKRYLEAEPLYLQALELRKKLLGTEHPSIQTHLNNLAELYREQKRYSEAELLYLQALKIIKKIPGEQTVNIVNTINNLASLYSSQGRYLEAEPLFLQALELYKQLLGDENLYIATSLNNLADLYSKQKRYSEAELLYLRALELRKKLLGTEHLDIATSLNNLALIYRIQQKYSEAESLLLQELELHKKMLGEENPDVAKNLHNLALIYNEQKRYSDAELLFSQALKIAKKVLGEKHTDTVNIRENFELFNYELFIKKQLKFEK